MKVEYINPFIESVYDLFTTMLGAEAKRGDVGFSKDVPPSRDISRFRRISSDLMESTSTQ